MIRQMASALVLLGIVLTSAAISDAAYRRRPGDDDDYYQRYGGVECHNRRCGQEDATFDDEFSPENDEERLNLDLFELASPRSEMDALLSNFDSNSERTRKKNNRKSSGDDDDDDDDYYISDRNERYFRLGPQAETGELDGGGDPLVLIVRSDAAGTKLGDAAGTKSGDAAETVESWLSMRQASDNRRGSISRLSSSTIKARPTEDGGLLNGARYLGLILHRTPGDQSDDDRWRDEEEERVTSSERTRSNGRRMSTSGSDDFERSRRNSKQDDVDPVRDSNGAGIYDLDPDELRPHRLESDKDPDDEDPVFEVPQIGQSLSRDDNDDYQRQEFNKRPKYYPDWGPKRTWRTNMMRVWGKRFLRGYDGESYP